MEKRFAKLDRMVIGVLFGAILPVLGFVLAYYVIIDGMTFEQYCNYSLHGAERQNIWIFSLLPNMFLFYLSNFRWNLGEFTKGLVGVTLLLGLTLVILSL